MRKVALLLLLAGAASPALAADNPFERVRERSESRSERSSDERPRVERTRPSEPRAERVRPSESRTFENRRERVETQAGAGDDRSMRRRFRDAVATPQPSAPEGSQSVVVPSREREARPGGSLRDRINEAANNGTLQPRDRDIRTVPGTVTTHRRDRDGWSRDGRSGHRWVRTWRDDRRYDWRHYRDRNRSTFRLGFYYDPFGYSYRRYGIGSYLYPSYYQSNYWLNDPWQYRLPPAYGPYRWVRYYNDALLIDTWSGEVVDVIHGFFW